MIIQRIEIAFECIGLASLILLVFVAAVLRWFGIDMSWSVDMAQLTFAWVCFIGADLAMRQDRHMGVDMLVDKFSLKTRNGIYLFNTLLILIFLAIITVYGINLSIINVQRKFNTLPISYSFATASAPVGGILMIYTCLCKIVRSIKNFITNDYSSIEKKLEGGEIV